MAFSFEINPRLLVDARDIPKENLGPIVDYEMEPLVSLEEACQPLQDILGNELTLFINVAKQNSTDPKDGLTLDESASIYLYTMEWDPAENSLHVVFNRALRAVDRSELRPWFKYMKLFFTALHKLPNSKHRTVWRGVPEDISGRYEGDLQLTWWPLTSCTSSFETLQSPMYLGRAKQQTVFAIETANGKLISAHSHLQNDDEILLLPDTLVRVTGFSNPAEGVHIVHLSEMRLPSMRMAAPFEAEETNLPDTSRRPRIADIQHLLNYLDIFYPDGQPISLEIGHDDDGIPFYRDEVSHFYNLAGQWGSQWELRSKPVLAYMMARDPEQIAKADWKKIKHMLDGIIRSGRFAFTTEARAISDGYIRLILLRMKELAEQEEQ